MIKFGDEFPKGRENVIPKKKRKGLLEGGEAGPIQPTPSRPPHAASSPVPMHLLPLIVLFLLLLPWLLLPRSPNAAPNP